MSKSKRLPAHATKGAQVSVKVGSETITVTITGEKCWQCRRVSVGTYYNKFGGESEMCIHGCGPRELCRMLRF